MCSTTHRIWASTYTWHVLTSHTWQPELLTYNIESLVCWWCGSCGHSTALHHCPIELSSGSEPEGGGHVCYTIHVESTNTCEGGLIVKVSTLYGGGWTTPTVIRGCSRLKHHSSWIHKDWSSSPSDNSSLDHSAGEGHHLLWKAACLPSTVEARVTVATGISEDWQ